MFYELMFKQLIKLVELNFIKINLHVRLATVNNIVKIRSYLLVKNKHAYLNRKITENNISNITFKPATTNPVTFPWNLARRSTRKCTNEYLAPCQISHCQHSGSEWVLRYTEIPQTSQSTASALFPTRYLESCFENFTYTTSPRTGTIYERTNLLFFWTKVWTFNRSPPGWMANGLGGKKKQVWFV